MAGWPVMPFTPSPNSWFDHFPSLDTNKWATVVSGTGSVTNTDSYEQLTGPANSAAFMYYKTQIDKTKSQLWQVCASFPVGGGSSFGKYGISLLNGASAPVADTHTNINAKTVIRQNIACGSGASNLTGADYWNASNAQVFWDGTNNLWTTTFPTGYFFIGNAREDDFYIYGIEIDGPGSRWRQLCWCKSFTTAGTFQNDQGWRLYAISDWVTWTNTRTSTNLWLVVGTPFNDDTVGGTCRVEWVRYIEAPTGNLVMDAWAGGGSRIRHNYSYDGKVYVPRDRSTDVIAPGTSGAWDDLDINEPFCVYDGSTTDYLFYDGIKAGGGVGIGYATATHASPQTNTFTKYASNPIITQGSSGANDDAQIAMPCVILDNIESDSNKRWKILYSAKKASDSKWRIMYATAPSPSGTWTKQGVVINVGGSGASDEVQARDPIVVRNGGQWVVFYAGMNSSNRYCLMWATGTDLATLTKQGTLYTPNPTVTDQALTASLNTAPGRSVAVASSSGFQVDAAVMISQDTSNNNNAYSKIRKIPDSTHIELYHGVTGMTTTTPARIKQIDATQNFSLRSTFWNPQTGEWWYNINFWFPFMNSPDGASYGGVIQEGHLFKLLNPSPVGGTPAISYLDSPIIPRYGGQSVDTAENASVLNVAFTGDPTLVSASDSGGASETAQVGQPKTYYVPTTADGNFSALVDGTAQTAANRTDGWTVAKVAATNSCEYDSGTVQLSTAFSLQGTTAKPASFLTGTTANAFKTPAALNGTFNATNWLFTFAVRATVASAQAGRMRLRVFKSVNADGSSATELTGATQVGTTSSALSTSADVTTVVTWTPGSQITLNNEYLFFVIAWEITTASGSTTGDVVIRTGSAGAGSSAVTPSFFPVVSTPISGTDANSTTTEAQSTVAQISSSDSGSAIPVEVANAQHLGTDANGATTESANFTFALSSSDSGSSSESASISVPISASDAHTDSESASLTSQLPASDAGSIAEIGTLVASIPSTDANGTITEAFSIGQTATDAGSDSETASTVVTPITSTDSNSTTTESASTSTGNPVASSDSATGSDATGNLVTQIASSASGSEAEAALLNISGFDSGTTSEIGAPAAPVSSSDSGTLLTETANVSTANAKNDSDFNALPVETASVRFLVSSVDSGSASDSAVGAVPISVTDAGSGVDVGAPPRVNISDLDGFFGSDIGAAVAAILVADSGTDLELGRISPRGTDNGAGLDSSQLYARLTDTDSGYGANDQDRYPPIELFPEIPAGSILTMARGEIVNTSPRGRIGRIIR